MIADRCRCGGIRFEWEPVLCRHCVDAEFAQLTADNDGGASS
jgi:hypothetical protein